MSDAEPMNQAPLKGKPDNEGETGITAVARHRASTFAFVLLVGSIIFSCLGISDYVDQPFSDLSKVIAVGLFVGAMVALAMGMIGDAYHRK